MKKIILLISIFFIGLTGIHSNEVQVLDDSQNIYNVNLSFSQNEELFSKNKIIDFKKKSSTDELPDSIKTEYNKYIRMGYLGIALIIVSGGCALITFGANLLTIISVLSFLQLIPFLAVCAFALLFILPAGLILLIYGFTKARSIKNSYFSYDTKFKKDEVSMNSQMEIGFAVKL